MSRKRNLDLEQEMSEDRETYEPAPDAVMLPPALEPAAPAPPLPAGFDMATFAAMLANAIQQGTIGAIERTKPPVREVDNDAKSVYHPEGNTVPRPRLEVPTFWGVIDETHPNNPPAALYEMEEAQLTDEEIIALNSIAGGAYLLKMYGGGSKRERLQVYYRLDLYGNVHSKVLGLPKHCYAKDMRNNVPGPAELPGVITAVA